MIIIDTCAVIYLTDKKSPYHQITLDNVRTLKQTHELVYNDMIYTELSIGFKELTDLDFNLNLFGFRSIPFNKDVLQRTGHAFLEYKRNDGNEIRPLPDFFIGAQAEVLNIPILTNDDGRYKTYFPKVRLLLLA